MENQYFTSPLIAAELAMRLAEGDGPEVIIISTEHSPSYFDQVTMDRTRLTFIQTLQQADRHGRFRAYSPVTTLGRTIIVHAALTIIDDTPLRIGSSNINNRSFGFDTECDHCLEAELCCLGFISFEVVTPTFGSKGEKCLRSSQWCWLCFGCWASSLFTSPQPRFTYSC